MKESKDPVLLYENKTEKKFHMNAIHLLALNMEMSVDEVKKLYQIVLKRLKRESKIKEFLPLLVSKRVEYLFNVRKTLHKKLKGRAQKK